MEARFALCHSHSNASFIFNKIVANFFVSSTDCHVKSCHSLPISCINIQASLFQQSLDNLPVAKLRGKVKSGAMAVFGFMVYFCSFLQQSVKGF